MEPGEFLGGVVVIVAVLAVLVATSWATYKRRWRKAGTWGALLVCLLLYLAFNAMKIADLAEWHQRCDRTSRMIDATARQVSRLHARSPRRTTKPHGGHAGKRPHD